MTAVRIKVGASSDGSMLTVFKPLIDAARQARVAIANEMKGMSTDIAAGYRSAPEYAKKAFGKGADEAEKADKRITDSAAKAAREREKTIEHVFQIKQRFLQEEQRAVEQALAKQQAAQQRIGSAAMGSFAGYMRRSAGFVSGIARGIGVDLDPGALAGNVVKQQAAATGISASGYLEGEKGAAGARQDPKKILEEARSAADVARISTDTALEGLQAFVGKTTDLETGRALLESMAKQSKATGANMADVMDAAGTIAVKMGDVPRKAEAVANLMGIIAKQGKVGAVEMKTMASQIAGFIGPANKFKEGIGGAVTELGTLFQVTNKFGGVKGAAQAGTSVAAFVADLTSKSGTKALHGAGLKDEDIFADKGRTQIKNLADIIPMMLEKSGGDLTKLAKTMPNKRASSVLGAFAQIYNNAERAEKGTGKEAVAQTFKTYGGGTSKGDSDAALAAANNDTASKVQLFNNQLEKIAEGAMVKFAPALESLAPKVVLAAEAFAKIAGWAAENPASAITAAITASIAKAAVGEAVSKSITSAIGGKGGLALGALALTATAVTLITQYVDDKRGEAKKGLGGYETNAEDTISAVASKYKAGGKQAISAEDLEALRHAKEDLKAVQAAGGGEKISSFDVYNPFSDKTAAQQGAQQYAGEHSKGIDDAMKNIDALTRAIERNKPVELPKVLDVRVIGGGTPVADSAGRSK